MHHPRLKRNQKKEKLTPQQMMIRNQRMKNPVKRAHLNGQKKVPAQKYLDITK